MSKSINVYINQEIRKDPKFTSKPYSDNSGFELKIDGLSITVDKKRLCIMPGDGPIPEAVLPYVEAVSIHEFISAERSYRETGIYRLGEDATAEVQLIDTGKTPSYFIIVTSKKMEAGLELLHKIKIGALRPDESYEGTQQGQSRADLEAELRTAKAALVATRAALSESQSELAIAQNRVTAAYRLAAKLDRQKWPVCLSPVVASSITAALNAGNA